jgi:hypothetical protein
VEVATDGVILGACIQSQGREVDEGRANERQSRLLLLVALELGVHDVELEQACAVHDVV